MAVVGWTMAFHSVFPDVDFEDSAPASTDLVCMLVAFMRPSVVVEAGTHRGRTALAMANIMRALGVTGRVHTADPEDRISETLAHPEIACLLPFLRYHQGDFLEMLDGIEDKVDLAYIDASAPDDPLMRWRHAKAVHARLRGGGLILVDDTEGDWEAAEWLRSWADDDGIHLSQQRGLTIIQKRDVPWRL